MNNVKFKNSLKQDLISNALMVFISALLYFLSEKIPLNLDFVPIIVFALSIVFAFSRTAVESIELLAAKKFSPHLLTTIGIILIFASKNYKEASLVAVIYSVGILISDFLNIKISDQLLTDDSNSLYYKTLRNGNEISLKADELEEGDLVFVKDGDFICFNGEAEVKGKLVKLRPGVINCSDKTVIAFKSFSPYEIDFNYLGDEKINTAKTLKIANIIAYSFAAIAVLVAVLYIALNFKNINNIFAILKILGYFTLVASPVIFCAGNNQSVYLLKHMFNQMGVTIKSSLAIEKLGQVKKIIFNKTSVFTVGELEIKDVKTVGSHNKDEVVKLAASLQKDCNNPVAKALKATSKDNCESQILDYEFYESKGVSGEINGKKIVCGSKVFMNEKAIDLSAIQNSSLYVAVDGFVIGAIDFKDILKGDAIKANKIFNVKNIKTAIFSGDSEEVIQKISKHSEFFETHSLSSKEQKEVIISQSQKQFKTAVLAKKNESFESCYITINYNSSENENANIIKENSLSNFALIFDKFKYLAQFITLKTLLGFIICAVLLAVVYFNWFDNLLLSHYSKELVNTGFDTRKDFINTGTLISVVQTIISSLLLLFTLVFKNSKENQ